MIKDTHPLIFIHKGDSSYMAYTLKLAATFNPDKDVILLGDDSNRHYATDGVLFEPYDTYLQTDAAKDFTQHFRYIANCRYRDEEKGMPVEDWVRFVFLRWFAIQGAAEAYGADAFWTFDTDTMVGTRLSRHEKKFADIDATEQCNGMCLNGYVNSLALVSAYTNSMRDLFHDEEKLSVLEAQIAANDKQDLLTEMKAWRIFKDEQKPRTRRLNEIIEGESFDECICFDHGMEMCEVTEGSATKRLFVSDKSDVMERHLDTNSLVNIMTINLSWCPDQLFEELYYIYMRKLALNKDA